MENKMCNYATAIENFQDTTESTSLIFKQVQLIDC